MNWSRALTVTRTDVKQLVLAKDFWMPMTILGSIFFVIVPLGLLLSITALGDVAAVQNIADTLELLPAKAQEQIRGDTPSARSAYALAVFLFAPMAVVVPLTISTAVGAASLVGERERGTGEFLAHSPASTREIYLGKLLASLLPGYVTTMVGFGAYSLIVNLIVGPKVGGWFFPTTQWWLLMFWVLPGFLLIGLSGVAPVGPGQVDRSGAAGIGPDHTSTDRGLLRAGVRRDLRHAHDNHRDRCDRVVDRHRVDLAGHERGQTPAPPRRSRRRLRPHTPNWPVDVPPYR